MPLMHAVTRQPGLWNQDKVRTTFEGTPHAQVDDILLRFGGPDGDDLIALDRPEMAKFPVAKKIALDLMALLSGAQLGRVVITRLEPGKKILPHKDVNGEYAKFYSRYHVILQGLPGSLFMCGDETVNMLTGECWWFDASAEHMLANNSKDDRIHMLVDIRIDQ
jgi:Aspartyl/Asparaginyl beta-hydroxylase